jgi:hypothetical protein
MRLWMQIKPCSLTAALLLSAAPLTLLAQSTPLPVKPGLWEMQSNANRPGQAASGAPALPPEAEAKIAALPPAQQAQVRAMMSASAGGAARPAPTTIKVCLAGQPSLDSMLNQSQRSSGMQCTFTNRSQTANGVSFDTSCTGPQGNAKGHTEIHLIDDEHVSSSNHMTISGSANGHDFNSTIDASSTGRFVSADCGDVKPLGAPPAK